MAVLFRSSVPVDEKYWIPALKVALADCDFRIWPDTGRAEDIKYLIGWDLKEGDKNAFPNLKAFLTLRAGVERNVHSPHFPEGAILVRMIDPGLTQSMIEYVLSFILRFHREHDKMSVYLEPPWWRFIPKRAAERTVGLMGLGHLGRACAEKLIDMDFRVKSWSKAPKHMTGVASYAGEAQLPSFLEDTEILVCLLPLTAETKGILNRDVFRRLPQGAHIINVARGQHLNEEDLTEYLDNGHLSMAVLDVFSREPLPPDHVFLNHPKVIVTPHLAATTVPETGVQVLRQSIGLLEKGLMPPGTVDRQKGY